MIHNQFLLILFLLAIESGILFISAQPRFKKYFSFLPAVFWMYFLPMIASSVGLIDSKSNIYSLITTYLLPASLVLLLLSSDIKSIMKLGRPALLMMFAGSLGIIVGTAIVYFIFKNWVGVETWSGFGALSASWTGGSANLIAAREALGTPDPVFFRMVIVDTVVPYLWMGILVTLVGFQARFDKWNRSDKKILDELNQNISDIQIGKFRGFKRDKVLAIVAVAGCGTIISLLASKWLPAVKDVITAYSWTIIVASFLGIGVSLTRLKKLENFGASRIGYFLLYFVLTSIGAKASISNIGSAIVLIFAGCLIVLIHAACLLFAARVIRAPMFLIAAASQANVGGVASAPVVAEIYQPGFATVGLLLAVLGNIVGTYLGILTGRICHWLSFFN